ncbi:Ankrd28, partial [Symbiodinium sp. KB8]
AGQPAASSQPASQPASLEAVGWELGWETISRDTLLKLLDLIRQLGPLDTWFYFLKAVCAPLQTALPIMQQTVLRCLVFAGHRTPVEETRVAERNRSELLISVAPGPPIGLPLGQASSKHIAPLEKVAQAHFSAEIGSQQRLLQVFGYQLLTEGISDILIAWTYPRREPVAATTVVARQEFKLEGGNFLFVQASFQHQQTKTLAKYFLAQLQLLDDMVKEKNCMDTAHYQKFEQYGQKQDPGADAQMQKYSYNLCLCGASDPRLPTTFRAAFYNLLISMWLDRYPHAFIAVPALIRSFDASLQLKDTLPVFDLGELISMSTTATPDSWSALRLQTAEHAAKLPEELPVRRFICAGRSVEQMLHGHAEEVSPHEPLVMYTVSVASLLAMREIQMHEELLRAGALVPFEESLGSAMFVSHQWLSNDHPDPWALLTIHQVISSEFSKGASDLSRADRQRAIDNIVTYVSRCRTERVARELAVRDDGFVVIVESETQQHVMSSLHRHLDSPGAGLFTLETDRARVGRVLVQMVWKKLQCHLEQGDMHNFRYLLSTQDICCLSGLGFLPLEGLMPGFVSQADPFTYPEAFAVERFLHDTGFKAVSERDSAGWTPMCYAVLSGKQFLVEALLRQKADCNDRITRHKPKMLLPQNMPVLSLAAYFRRNGVLKLLLSARAKVNAVDGHQGVAIHWASVADNVEGLQTLCDAEADLSKLNLPGFDAFQTACFSGSLRVVQAMLQNPSTSLRHGLHAALMADGGTQPVISTLIQARADVNEQYKIEPAPLLRFILLVQRLRHRVSPSRLTALCYHHPGATPLMLSLMSCLFKASYLLLEAGADTTLRNQRGKRAADFAREANAPTHLVDILEGRAHISHAWAANETDDEDLVEI